jgi:hypothetical protein
VKKLVLPLLFAASTLSAATLAPPSKAPPSPQPPAGPVLEEKKAAKPYKMEKIVQTEEVVLPTSVAFNLPGIIGIQDGVWRGTDHLLNLTNNIAVQVDIMTGDDIKLPFDEQDVKRAVEDALTVAGIKPNVRGQPGSPPLPYLHFLIMAQKCNEEVAVYIQARLFEKVRLERVALPGEVVFQAITWEDENLLVIEATQVKTDVFAQLNEMSSYFIQRYNFFEKETNRIKAK